MQILSEIIYNKFICIVEIKSAEIIFSYTSLTYEKVHNIERCILWMLINYKVTNK
jgi:hypothetical protein